MACRPPPRPPAPSHTSPILRGSAWAGGPRFDRSRPISPEAARAVPNRFFAPGVQDRPPAGVDDQLAERRGYLQHVVSGGEGAGLSLAGPSSVAILADWSRGVRDGVQPVGRYPVLPFERFIPDFPDESPLSAWRLRRFPGKPSVSDPFLPKRQSNPMGDSYHDPLRVDFDRQIKLEFHGSTVTSDAGLLPYRELDEALGLTRTVASGLHDTRTGQNTQHRLLALLRQSIYRRLRRRYDAERSRCARRSGAERRKSVLCGGLRPR